MPWVHSHDDEHDYDDSVRCACCGQRGRYFLPGILRLTAHSHRLPISTTGWAEYDYTHKHLKHMPGPRQMVQHCPHNCSVFSLTLRKGKWTARCCAHSLAFSFAEIGAGLTGADPVCAR